MALHIMDEANRCLQCKNPQCVKGCPISTPIPDVIRLLKDNKLDEVGRKFYCYIVINYVILADPQV